MSDNEAGGEPPLAVSSEDIQAAPRRTGRSRLDLIIALTAILLSVISLYVAIENARTQREMVSASTWPYVAGWVKIDASENGVLQFGLANSGVGPAKVHSFEVFYKDQPISSTRDLLRRCCGLPADPKLANAMLARTSAMVVSDIVLKAGDDQTAFALALDPAYPDLARQFAKALRQLSFDGCYCSVLNECWRMADSGIEPRPVKTCRPSQHPFDPAGP